MPVCLPPCSLPVLPPTPRNAQIITEIQYNALNRPTFKQPDRSSISELSLLVGDFKATSTRLLNAILLPLQEDHWLDRIASSQLELLVKQSSKIVLPNNNKILIVNNSKNGLE